MSSPCNRLRRWRVIRPLLAGVVLAWAGAPSAHAAVVTNFVTISTNYYFAYGATAAALHQSLQQAKPWRATADVDAQTAWSVNYRFSFKQEEGRFSPSRFELRTKILVTLPFWHMPKDVEPELRQRWLEYLRALYTHEQGHVDIARQAAAELGQQLAAIGDYPSAKELRQTIEQTSTNVIARLRQKEVLYDVTTKHGATQGAVLRLGPSSPSAAGRTATAAPPK